MERLIDFREQLYRLLHLYNRADVIFDVIDALSSAQGARSPVELSLTAAFRGRHYAALYQGVKAFLLGRRDILRLLLSFQTPRREQPFYLYSLDTKPVSRLYASCLADRHFTHRSTPIPGQKPITVGHMSSILAFLPEKEDQKDPPWAPPCDATRVPTTRTYLEVAYEQCRDLLKAHSASPDELLFVADSGYGRRAFIYPLVAEEGTHVLVRLRNNRVLYCPPAPKEPNQRGRPPWYGERFALNDPTTWPKPDREVTWEESQRNGRSVRIRLQVWYEMRIRNKGGYAMHACPFTLICVTVTTPDGRPLYARPLWLALFGPKRRTWDPKRLYEAYRQRFDQEHMHRFLARHLLATAFQTPETAHEERWWHLVILAYFQLWLASSCAQTRWRPWEKHLAKQQQQSQKRALSPTLVQRDFPYILSQLGTPARCLKPRGNPKGRAPGQRLKRRTRHKIVRKGRKKAA